MSNAIRITQASLVDLRQLAGEQRLFAILDACDAPKILAKVRELGPERAFCLYRGEISQEMEEIAPYLTNCDEFILQWLFGTAWNTPWGVFIVAKADLAKLLKHLRKFLVVQDPDEESVYFRYYDPRVLPIFIESCNQKEVSEFYGPVQAYGYTVSDSGDVEFVLRTQ